MVAILDAILNFSNCSRVTTCHQAVFEHDHWRLTTDHWPSGRRNLATWHRWRHSSEQSWGRDSFQWGDVGEGRGEQHPELSTPTTSQTPLSVTADCRECAQRPGEHAYLSSSVRSGTILELESFWFQFHYYKSSRIGIRIGLGENRFGIGWCESSGNCMLEHLLLYGLKC